MCATGAHRICSLISYHCILLPVPRCDSREDQPHYVGSIAADLGHVTASYKRLQ